MTSPILMRRPTLLSNFAGFAHKAAWRPEGVPSGPRPKPETAPRGALGGEVILRWRQQRMENAGPIYGPSLCFPFDRAGTARSRRSASWSSCSATRKSTSTAALAQEDAAMEHGEALPRKGTAEAGQDCHCGWVSGIGSMNASIFSS
jgi:hypothetical protein